MKTVVFDVDGVLADFSLHFRTLANKHYGLPIYSDNEQYAWVMSDLTKEQDDWLWRYVEDGDNAFWVTMPQAISDQDADRVLDLTRRDDRLVYFVTSRVGDSAKSQTEDWLTFRFGIRTPTVIISKAKHLVCRGIKADYFIDDKYENAIAVGYDDRRIKSFLLDKPYNRGFDSDRVVRINSLSEYLDVVEG